MKRPAGLAHRFIQYSGRLAIPTIVLAELYAGAYMLPNPNRILTGIADLLLDVTILPFDEACAEEFGKLRGLMKQQGIIINPIDLQIAAVAIAQGLILVTNNTKDFQNIPGLTLVDWLTP